MSGINSSFLVQSSNFVQSNDLVYRTALDVLGFQVPLCSTSRNKDERRENIAQSIYVVGTGFLFIPLEVLGLNKIFAKQFLNKNDAYFKLNWQSLDPGKNKEAVKQLEKAIEIAQERLKNPSWFDKLGFIKKGIHKNISKLQEAIEIIQKNPEILKKVAKSKKYVLFIDFLITATALCMVGPIKILITKLFAHKNRFTGTENYLSDKDLNKLVKKEDKNLFLKKAIHIGSCLLPFVIAFATHHLTQAKINKGLQPNKILMKIRNSMDYTNAVFLSLGGMVNLYLAANLDFLNWARDKYERRENLIKVALTVPSFFFGDYIFNGNIAKITDRILYKSGLFDKGTFIKNEQSSIFGGHTKEIKKVIEEVEKKYGKEKASLAGKIATGVFLAGFIAHALAIGFIFTSANAITRKIVKRDLSKVNDTQKTNNSK